MSRFSKSTLARCVDIATAALGVATWHTFTRKHHQPVYAKSCKPKFSVCERKCGDQARPGSESCEKQEPDLGPLDLKLKQAHVFFKHSFITPLSTTPRSPQAEYDHQLVMREHQFTLFPYDKLDACSGCPKEYSDYQKGVQKMTIRGGVYPGALTGYGKDEMFLFGKQLRDHYLEPLDVRLYDPKLVNVLSTNVRRTVESARCVLAGLYGSPSLNYFTQENGPVPIFVTSPSFNILIPDTFNCKALADLQHAAFVHHDFFPDIGRAKAVIEKILGEQKQLLVDDAQTIQDEINKIWDVRSQIGVKIWRTPLFNKYRQPYLCDEDIDHLLLKRSQALEKIPYFWSDVFSHSKGLKVTPDDMKGLSYLTRLVVEEFKGKFQRGTRFTLHFDSNPYFHNRILTKEVYHHPTEGGSYSWETPIVWKKCGKLYSDEGPDNCKSPSQCIIECKDYDETIHCFEGQSQLSQCIMDRIEKSDNAPSCQNLSNRLVYPSVAYGSPFETFTMDEQDLVTGDEILTAGEETLATVTKTRTPVQQTQNAATKALTTDQGSMDESCLEKFEPIGEPAEGESQARSPDHVPPPSGKKKKQGYGECNKSSQGKAAPKIDSFFQWLDTNLVGRKKDPVGDTLRDKIWPDPLAMLGKKSTKLCINPECFDFLAARNDFQSRYWAGHLIPLWMAKFCDVIEESGQRIIYGSVVGQTDTERTFVTRLAAGPLLETVFSRVERLLKGRDAPRLCLYSCHDSTLIALMEALDITDCNWPNFGAHLKLELYENGNTKEYYLKVYYNDEERIIRCQDSPIARLSVVKGVLKNYFIKPVEYIESCNSEQLKELNPCIFRHQQCDEMQRCLTRAEQKELCGGGSGACAPPLPKPC